MSKYTSRLTTLENHDTIEDTKLDAVRAPESVRQENAYAGQRDSDTFGKKWQLSWWTPAVKPFWRLRTDRGYLNAQRRQTE